MKIDITESLTARIEAFDTFWEAPENIEKGYFSFYKFYKRNYLKHIHLDNLAKILVISCGPGYFVELMKKNGYKNVLGIDSDEEKISYATMRGLNCKVEHAIPFLSYRKEKYHLIFVEQEINHLTKKEIIDFLNLCRSNLYENGMLIIHSLNGANPITGSEALAQNYDHYNTFTEYSLKQVLKYCKFKDIEIFPLRLYIFYENPVNYLGLLVDGFLNLVFKMLFVFYGKKNRIFSKKIAAICKA